jgi:hypothetical protein
MSVESCVDKQWLVRRLLWMATVYFFGKKVVFLIVFTFFFTTYKRVESNPMFSSVRESMCTNLATSVATF